MKNVVMGTAGHIDHGKTTLVKKLTGIDTDRLQEEKRRGMTIELGFAPLKLPSGDIISIVDVPGHEKFIKTMVAGSSGIDFVMLVIAADEGIMPQTKEHIDIISLLNVKSGVIALTKTDLVDEEWIKMVQQDIKNELSGTALEGIDIIPVSSKTGKGIDKLLEKLEELSTAAAEAKSQEFFRMPIDRVFTIQGHGTVITGTVLGGKISKGQTVNILTSGISAKVREIQVHNEKAEAASAGQRCALNLLGIEKNAVNRGDVITTENWIKPLNIIDAVIYVIKGKFEIKNNDRVHVNIGTKEILARIKIMGFDKITSDSKGYVKLKFEEPITALRGDRFIIRAFSPVVTLGGGWVLSHSAENKERFKGEVLETFKIEESSDIKKLIMNIMEASDKPLDLDEIWHKILGEKSEILKILKDLSVTKEIIALKLSDKYISKHLCKEYYKRITDEFTEFYKNNPFRFEIDKEEIKSRLFDKLDAKDFSDILNYYFENNMLLIEKNMIRENDSRTAEIFDKKEVKLLESTIFQYGLNLKTSEQVKREISDKAVLYNYEEIQKFLLRSGLIVDLGNNLLVHREIIQDIVKKIRNIFESKEVFTAVYLRDYLNCSRKTAISILEYLDNLGVTERQKDERKPGVRYMDYFI